MLSGERGFPKILKSEFWQLLRDAERKGVIVKEEYRSNSRNLCQRWRVASACPLIAFSVSSPNENAETEGGTHPVSSPEGGMGGEDTHAEDANACAPPTARVLPKRTRRTQK